LTKMTQPDDKASGAAAAAAGLPPNTSDANIFNLFTVDKSVKEEGYKTPYPESSQEAAASGSKSKH
jgi:hypothetical protein